MEINPGDTIRYIGSASPRYKTSLAIPYRGIGTVIRAGEKKITISIACRDGRIRQKMVNHNSVCLIKES